ncbi:dihydrofolate reductase family protein [Streptosporangium sp. NPDC023963]|uniref:dihydrofolate reductase family protein n=1 Tax=Streptosporangium sp. NPDC023963 TaxID=3155608 RepID=UPI0034471763
MRKIVVVEHLTLDGVMQAPGAPDEDVRGGFGHGGWAASRNDAVMGGEMAKGMGGSELLFGRLTYERFHSFWPKQPANPFTEVLNDTRKYVASTTLTGPLPWANSTLLAGDAATAVAELKKEPGADVAVLGSGELVRSLMRHDLVDVYKLMIHPLVLGSGRRLFPENGPLAGLRLTDSVTTTTGVVIATYDRS